MADETKVIDVFLGPYRGHRLTVPAADADSAVNGHWATDANAPPPNRTMNRTRHCRRRNAPPP